MEYMQYRSYWEWLAISPTTDIAAIKKAFAARIKEYHPEEHPEEFMALQKAYKSAIAYAKAAGSEEVSEMLVFQDMPQETFLAENGNAENFQDMQGDEETGNFEKYESIDGNFDYGKILNGEKGLLEQRFFLCFDAIAENSCICKNEKIWHIFLSLEEYQPYFEEEDFCRRLLETVLKRKYLSKEVFRIFVKKLEQNSALAAALAGDVSNPAAQALLSDKNFAKSLGKLKRMAEKNDYLSRLAKYTRNMLIMHQNVIQQARQNSMPTNVNSWIGAEAYLHIYIPYAVDHIEQIRKLGKSSRRQAAFADMLIWFGAAMAVVGLAVNIWVLPAMKNQSSEAGAEKKIEENFGENIGKDDLFDDDLAPDFDGNAYIDDMDAVMKDMIERYEKWQQENEKGL